MTYASYSTYTGPVESQEAPVSNTPVVREATGMNRITINDGAVSSTSNHRSHEIRAGDLSPFAGDDWRSGAMTPNGYPATKIEADTILNINGTQAKAKDFAAAGILQETAQGFELAGNTQVNTEHQEAPMEASDAVSMPSELASAVDDALEAFDDHTLSTGLPLAISATTGELSMEDVVRSVVTKSGLDPKDAQERIQFTMDAYKAMVGNYVTRQGIDKGDLESFYEFSRGQRGDLRNALTKMMHNQDLSAWKGLVTKYQASHAPNLQTLQSRGFQTRTTGSEPEVRINGIWTSVRGAARAGLI